MTNQDTDVVYLGYTRTELDQAFKLVQNKEHWKGSIEAVIPKDQYSLTNAAVGFFTGDGIEIKEENKDGTYLIVADGYWETMDG